MSKIAIYPGTFDPITNGHVDIVVRAAALFDKVIVAIAKSSSKKPVLSLDERVTLAKTALQHIDRVEVQEFNILLTKYASEQSAKVIVRGLRMVSDFEYEFQLASMNRHLSPEIETIFLTPAEQYSHLSSSLVREIAALGGDVSSFVHKDVVSALKRKV